MASRWDFLFDVKPVSLTDHLLTEVAKLLTKDLAKWPPPIEELDAELGSQFRPLFEPDAQRPSSAVYDEAFKLAKLELEREIQAVDDYMRNQRWRERGVAPGEKLALLFLSRWLVEQLLGLKESTSGKITRPLLLDCLERARALL